MSPKGHVATERQGLSQQCVGRWLREVHKSGVVVGWWTEVDSQVLLGGVIPGLPWASLGGKGPLGHDTHSYTGSICVTFQPQKLRGATQPGQGSCCMQVAAPGTQDKAAADGGSCFPITGSGAWQGEWGLHVHYRARAETGTRLRCHQPRGAGEVTSAQGHSRQPQARHKSSETGRRWSPGWVPKDLSSLALLAWQGTSARYLTCWGRGGWGIGARALSPRPGISCWTGQVQFQLQL